MNKLIKTLAATAAFAMTVCASGEGAESPQSDATYKQLKTLLGGTWVMSGPNLDAQAKWVLGPDGVSLHGETTIAPKGQQASHALARFGWDPVAKKVYYLDAHDSETVYLGHVEPTADGLEARFKTVVGSPSEWSFTFKFNGPDQYVASLFPIKDGKKGNLMLSLTWNRKK
jgi:hypothetical protein